MTPDYGGQKIRNLTSQFRAAGAPRQGLVGTPGADGNRYLAGRLVKDEAWAKKNGLIWGQKQLDWVKPGSSGPAAGGGYGTRYNTATGASERVVWSDEQGEWVPA
jgi:hypothetical protein